MGKLSDEDREDLIAYLDNELDEAAVRRVESKLHLDPKARSEAEALRQAWGMLDYLPRADPSPSFSHKTLERLALQTGTISRRRCSWLGVLAWTAAALLAAGAGFAASGLLWRHQPSETPDLKEQMVRHLRVIERIHLYNQVDDLDFLRVLDHPDLFGDEPGW